MYEVELKAHIDDPAAIKAKVASFATFFKHIDKNDDYYSANGITVRFRTEKYADDQPAATVFTYKRKELRDGVEVNDERECSVSDPSPICTAFCDAGFVRSLVKHKVSDFYTMSTGCGTANIEICLVETLGYFIEIEILLPENDDDKIAVAKKCLHAILKKCEVPESAIESRYYRELLEQKSKEA